MTPAARAAAAIEILDRILDGDPPEVALSAWARASRYAGSGDRAAVRDIVFDCLRRRRSLALRGGEGGRGLVLGWAAGTGAVEALFSGARFGPAPLTQAEAARLDAPPPPASTAEELDCPDWLWPRLERALGKDAVPFLEAMRRRAPTFLRANLLKTTAAEAARRLRAEGVETRLHPAVDTALEVTANARRIRASESYRTGLVELQDLSSQAAVAALPLRPGMSVLDWCAGGGGKALAMAARTHGPVFAHDANPARMADLPARAARAGADIRVLDRPAPTARFDLVLCDVPCSGSGTWRRDPAAKWRLRPADLDRLLRTQAAILDEAQAFVGKGGVLAYMTCSVLAEENEDQIGAFLSRHRGWRAGGTHRFGPDAGGDGFFASLLLRN